MMNVVNLRQIFTSKASGVKEVFISSQNINQSEYNMIMHVLLNHDIPYKYTRAPQTVHNTPVMNILKGFFYITLF